MRNRYIHGAHNVVDDRSGFEIKSTTAKKEWTGLLVDKSEWEPRQPQDFVKGKADRMFVADPRPEATCEFVGMYGKPVRPEEL